MGWVWQGDCKLDETADFRRLEDLATQHANVEDMVAELDVYKHKVSNFPWCYTEIHFFA